MRRSLTVDKPSNAPTPRARGHLRYLTECASLRGVDGALGRGRADPRHYRSRRRPRQPGGADVADAPPHPTTARLLRSVRRLRPRGCTRGLRHAALVALTMLHISAGSSVDVAAAITMLLGLIQSTFTAAVRLCRRAPHGGRAGRRGGQRRRALSLDHDGLPRGRQARVVRRRVPGRVSAARQRRVRQRDGLPPAPRLSAWEPAPWLGSCPMATSKS